MSRNLRVNLWRMLCLAVGLALLAAVAAKIDVGQALSQGLKVGWGMAVVLGLYFLAFLADALAWQMTLAEIPLAARWLYRVWKVRMVGEALNAIVPAFGLGGEPVKAMLLKHRYGISYGEGIASLILGQTILLVSLMFFLTGGFVLVLGSSTLRGSFGIVAGAGLATITLGVAIIISLQHLRLSLRVDQGTGQAWMGRRLADLLRHVRDIEDRLVMFYRLRRGRFVAALAWAVAPWLIGVLEVYVAALFLGHPVSLAEAWIIEAAVQMVRAGMSFIPAGLGAQEGTFVLVFAATTGSPDLGAAVAMVRRFREIVWLLGGGAVGLTFLFGPRR